MDKTESQICDYRRLNKDRFVKYIKKKPTNLPICKELQQIDKSDLLVSGDYLSVYPPAMAHKGSKWPKIETAVAINQEDSNCICEVFNTGEWKKIYKSGFFKVNYYNPKDNVFQYINT